MPCMKCMKSHGQMFKILESSVKEIPGIGTNDGGMGDKW